MWKVPYSIFTKKINKSIKKSRSVTIENSLCGLIIPVYNGIVFKRVLVKRARVGFKLGEFSITRKKYLKKKTTIKKKVK